MNRWMGWTLAAAALVASAAPGFACEQQAQAAEAKDVKTVAANVDAKGCNMPCCAHANAAANAAANEKPASDAPAEKPCTAHDAKGCPKKSGTTSPTVATVEPPKEAAKQEPPSGPGKNR